MNSCTCFVAVAVASLVLAGVEGSPADDLGELLKRFPGEYGNYMQWESDVEKNVSQADAHANLHSIFYGPVPLPNFGEHMFYVQQYLNGVPTDIYRQRLYSFASDAATGEIILSFYDFKNASKYVDSQKDPSKLKGLTLNDTTPVTKDCDVHIHRSADGIFRGQTTSACVVVDHNTGTKILIKDNNEFGPNYVSIHERGYDSKTGAKIFGTATPDVLNRTRAARLFTGYVALEPTQGHYGLMSNISIWDVGQIIPVVTDKGVKTKFAVELAYCTYPNGDHVLKVAIHEEGFTNDGLIVPVAYSWSQEDATQIGINLRYIQAGFSLVSENEQK